ncbi:MAG: hypothetical protein AB1918_18685 [Pseudomonadota bacterium]
MATIAHGRHPGKPAPHGGHAPSHHHPARPAHPGPRARKGHGGLIAGLAALALAAAGVAWWLAGDPSDGLTDEERLVKQIHSAAQGSAPPVHAFGGELKAVHGDRGLSVEAKGVPSKACVSAAWRLAREGIVTVNGTTPMRISAGILSELCAEVPEGATIRWQPRDEAR